MVFNAKQASHVRSLAYQRYKKQDLTPFFIRHERSDSYMFIKPSLKDIAKELASEMIKYMPPQTKK